MLRNVRKNVLFSLNKFTVRTFRLFSSEAEVSNANTKDIIEDETTTVNPNIKEHIQESSMPDEKPTITNRWKTLEYPTRLVDCFLNPKSYAFFDKTSLLQTVVQDNFTDIIIRPPYYGKTFTLSLIKEILSSTNFSDKILKSSKISEDITGIFTDNYVIYLKFDHLNSSTFDSNIERLREQLLDNYVALAKTIGKRKFELPFDPEKKIYERIINKQTELEQLSFILTQMMREVHRITDQYTFLLIDDYDVPLLNSARNNFYDKMVDFMKNLYANSLNNNYYLFKAVITGTQPVETNKLFVGIKSSQIHSIDSASPKYENSYGVSENELGDLIDSEQDFSLLKSVYSISDENQGIYSSYSFKEIINTLKQIPDGNNYLTELNIRDILLRLANEQSDDNSNIKLLCQLCVRSYQIAGKDPSQPINIKGKLSNDLNPSVFNSTNTLTQIYHSGLLTRVAFEENDLTFDLRNYAVASYILDNMPKESEFKNYDSRFILNYFINIYTSTTGKPNIKSFLDYVKRLSTKKSKNKVDFPVFRFEKELKNFFLKVFAFDYENFIVLQTADNPALNQLQIVISRNKDFSIVFDCRKLNRQAQPAKKKGTTKQGANEIDSANESDTELKPEIADEMKKAVDIAFKSINKKVAADLIQSKHPVNNIYYIAIANYQRQFEYILEYESTQPNKV